MRINIKKAMPLVVAIAITVGSTGTYAASFNDTSNHWAKEYIEKGKNAGLIEGFDDGSFKPQENVTRVQAIILSSRLIKTSQADVEKAVKKHGVMLLNRKLPDWTIGGISVALSEGIIDESILPKLISSNGAQTASSREEVAIFMTRAIGLKNEAESKGSSVYLNFKDAKDITQAARPYVLVMNEKKIMAGDDKGNFNPQDPIRRGEIAKVLSASYDYLKSSPSDDKKDDVTLTTAMGKIEGVFEAGNKRYIRVIDSTSIITNYEINNQSVLRLGDKIVSYGDLKIGLDVTLAVLSDPQGVIGVVKSLDSKVTTEKYDGTIYSLNEYGKTLTIEYQQGGIRNRNEYSLSEDVQITLDGKKVPFSNLRRGDDIKIELINNKLVKIDAKAKARDVKGILKEINIKDKYITVEDKDGNREKYELDKDVKIERNRRRVDVDKLRRGDEVEIHIEDKKVTTIYAKIVITEIEGTIKRKNIGYDESEITIFNNKTKKDEIYKIPKDVSIELNRERARLDQLELGYYVEITLEGEEIVEIKGQSTTINNKHLGRITAIERSYLELTLQDGTVIEVIFEDTLVKEDETGKEISTRSLSKGDVILVTGEIYQGEVIAKDITRYAK